MSSTQTQPVRILGGGLAGCEAALWLANHNIPVQLIEQKPHHYTPAHTLPTLAELVCSNSLKGDRPDSAGGLLKAEMRLLGSSLLPVADACRVPAGGALAVNREAFSKGVTALVEAHPHIQILHRQEQELHPEAGITLVATGPLTDGPLAQSIAEHTGGAQLAFYDAAAPIVLAESLDRNQIFAASRYDRGEADYLNCPFNKEGYEAFHTALLGAETAPLHAFDGPVTVYEGCMPVEVMARRGPDTMRYGPLRPVGLQDPRTGHRPWANVQLRAENTQRSMYNLVGFQTNLKFGEQKRIFGMIPGLQNAEFVRYGVMHRNTFLNSPQVLAPNLSLKNHPTLFFAGQITGFEGYMESAAAALLAAHAIYAHLQNKPFLPPPATTMCGALLRYITTPNKNFQPMGANMGLLPPNETPIRAKRDRYTALSHRAQTALQTHLAQPPPHP